MLSHSVSFPILQLRWQCRDKGDSMADGAYAATTNGSSGSLLSPGFLKASGAWEQKISLVCFRSVNLEFGFTASIYKHGTWHAVQCEVVQCVVQSCAGG